MAGPLRVVTIGGVAAPATGAEGWLLSILWLVGMTNAFNFMDGIDGIAGIAAGSAGFTLACAVGAAGCG